MSSVSAVSTVDASTNRGTAPDIPTTWLTEAQANIRQSEYQVTWQEQSDHSSLPATYQAPNRAHNLRTYFTPNGIRVFPRTETEPSWEWGLRLSGYGYGQANQPLAGLDLDADGNRLTYRWQDTTVGLREWYINDERGLEQGFSLQAPPFRASDNQPQGPLVLDLALSGNLTPALNEAGTAIDFTSPEGLLVLRYSDLYAYDATGRELPAWLELDATRIRLAVDDTAAIYPIIIDPLATSPDWTAESDQDLALFGFAAGTAGDVNNDGYDDVIVGAYGYDNGQAAEGRAFVYYGSATGLNPTPAWTAESNKDSANFGIAVGTAGDVNGDGIDDVIVGASGYANGQTLEGAAYVYYGSAAGLSTTADWMVESNLGLAYFGASVGTAGDVNNDGCDDVIVGAPQYYNGLELFEGAAYVYHGCSPEGGLSTTAAWMVEGNQAYARFGSAVGTAGDVNNDGFADIIVGAYGYDNDQAEEGRAFVYHGSMAGINPTAAWTAEGNQDSANFGIAVGTAGDVNNDGYDDVIVGAYWYTNGQTKEGRAFVYHGNASPTGLSATADWTAESDQASAYFGSAVGTAGDVNGDGFDDVIVGAPFYDNSEVDEGRAFVYYGSGGGLSTVAAWTAESDQASAYFGSAVGTAGDVNGDGYDDVIVGAYWYDNGQTDEGRTFVYHGSASGEVNNPPLADDQSVTTDEDAPMAITLTGSDADGDSLTFSVETGPTNGGLSGTAPNLTYTPNPNYNGSDSFTFKTNDGTLNSIIATVSITVNPVNDAPVADAQSVITTEDTPAAIILTGSDVDENSLTFIVVTTPANGSLIGTAPNLTYTPNPSYNGLDNFTFKTNDGTVDSSIATVSITVNEVNNPPLADDQLVTTDEDAPMAIILTGFDPDGDPLTFSVETGPTYGGLSGTAPNLTYSPNSNYNGPDSFTFKTNDGTLDSNIATVSITVNSVNDVPVGTFSYICTDLTCDFDASAFYDPDGSIVSYNWSIDYATDLGSGVTLNHTFATMGSYHVTLIVIDNENGVGADGQIVTVSEAPTIHVGNLEGTSLNSGKNWAAQVTVTIDDVGHQAMDGAIVNGVWSGGWSGSGSCQTDASGTCTLQSGDIPKKDNNSIFTISSVSYGSQDYNAADNHDPEGNSNGTAIQVNKDGTTSDPTVPTNQPPVASFSYTCTDLSCSFDASGSSDSDGSIVTYAWGFGDENSDNGVTPSHTYAAAGSYSVALTATDDSGATSTDIQSVNVSAASGGVTLTVNGYKVKGVQHADLTWSGAGSSDVDIYRDGAKIGTTANDGVYTDNIGNKGSGSYTYKVCEAGTTTTCSNEATVTF